MLLGGQTNTGITPAVLDLVKRAGFKAWKLMYFHTESDVVALRSAGIEHFTVRLRDMKELPRHADGTLASIQDWQHTTIQDAMRFYAMGIYDLQWGCEGNDPGKWGPGGADSYRYFAIRALPLIKDSLPGCIRLGLMPLSHAPGANDEGWRAAFKEPLNAQELQQGKDEGWGRGYTGSLLDWHAFVCVNSYWQTEGQATRADMGGSGAFYHDWAAGKTVQNTEFGYSGCDLQPRPSPADVEAGMLQMYPEWIAWAAGQPYIEAAYLFIVGGSPDWAGFAITERVAGCIAAALAALPRAEAHGGVGAVLTKLE